MNELPKDYTLKSTPTPSESFMTPFERLTHYMGTLADSVSLLAISVAALENDSQPAQRTDDTSEDIGRRDCQTRYGTMSFAGVKRGPIAGDEVAQAQRTLGSLTSGGFTREYIANTLLTEFAMKRGIL